MTKEDERKEKIRFFLEDMSDCELISCWNYYVTSNRYEEEIWDMSELIEFIQYMEPMKIIEYFCVPEFCQNDKYFYFNSLGNVYSFNYMSDRECPIELSDLVNYIADDNDCDDEDLREFLDDLDIEEDEEDEEVL